MTQVKVMVALARKPAVSKQYFHDHWRHPHATWGVGMGGRKHYVQCHQFDHSLLPDSQHRFDGMAEIWFDNLSDAAVYNQDPVYRNQLAPDEPNFADMRSVRFMVADEEVLVSEPLRHNGTNGDHFGWRELDRPTSIKVVQIMAMKDSEWLSADDVEFGNRIGAFRHVRCSPNPIVHEKGCFSGGIRELWWPTLTAFEMGVAGDPEAWKRLSSRENSTTFIAVAERYL